MTIAGYTEAALADQLRALREERRSLERRGLAKRVELVDKEIGTYTDALDEMRTQRRDRELKRLDVETYE